MEEFITLDRAQFRNELEMLRGKSALEGLKARVRSLRDIIAGKKNDDLGVLAAEDEENTVRFKRSVLLRELDQVLEAYTLERACYYIKRLHRSLVATKTNGINDINLSRWKEYDHIITDSLWIIDRRDTSGAHLGWYWGNFIPQIPHQLMLRYTRRGDVVVDPFAGSGTTLIECRRLGRHGIGVELNKEVAARARELIAKEPNPYGCTTLLETGDSRTIDCEALLHAAGVQKAQLFILHPPYHDIIVFSGDQRDLSNAASTEEFLHMFGQVVDNITPCLEDKRYMAVVIGDKYARGEWIPLGFYCMEEVLRRRFTLKSIIVKNFNETTGKRTQKELWRYRALSGGFYVFKHEYILLFQKK